MTWRAYTIHAAFIVALTATLGSLYTSAVIGWEPCVLCALQRIVMYPLVILLGVYLFYRPRWYRSFLIVISAVGGGTAAIHAALVWFDPTQGCGVALPCTMEYGLYIGSFGIQPVVLPLLSLTAFVFILASLLVYSSNE